MTRRDYEYEISTPSNDKTPRAPNLPPAIEDASLANVNSASKMSGVYSTRSCIALLCLMPRAFRVRQLNYREGQIENADQANARQSVAGSRATRSWIQTHLPISEHSRVALHLRTAERLEHRIRQLSYALRRHPHSFQACDSRVAPSRRDGRQTVAKLLRRWWRPGPYTQPPQTASCDLRVHSIRHRHTELEIFAAWQLLPIFRRAST